MIAGLDSSFDRPSAAQVAQAYQAGVRVWGGYLATNETPGAFNLESPWDLASFQRVQQGGMTAIGFCSGLDDPVALRALAFQRGVLLCLDDESGFRLDGSWVQPFLDASGAGLYGNPQYHAGRSAPFHILADYPCAPPRQCDPGATWGIVPRPPTPCGWQWAGTHIEFSLSVDRGWYDDWFATALSGGTVGGEMTPEEHDALFRIRDTTEESWGEIIKVVNESGIGPTGALLLRLDANVKALQTAGGALTPAQAQQLSDIAAALGRLEAALKQA